MRADGLRRFALAFCQTTAPLGAFVAGGYFIASLQAWDLRQATLSGLLHLLFLGAILCSYKKT